MRRVFLIHHTLNSCRTATILFLLATTMTHYLAACVSSLHSESEVLRYPQPGCRGDLGFFLVPTGVLNRASHPLSFPFLLT